jgi:hypothetical protein
VRSARARPNAKARAAVLVGVVASYIAAVNLVRYFRPAVLLDVDPAWALPRLLLGLTVFAGAAAAGVAAAALCFRFSGSAVATAEQRPVPLSRGTLLAIALSACLLGAFLRVGFLEWTTTGFFQDHISLVEPTLALQKSLRDFSDTIRPVPFPHAFGVVGVLYLEAFRWCLDGFGVTVFGIQFLSALSGTLCLATVWALARRLLPQGGWALAVLALAGMRWHLILSLWGFHGIAVTLLLDVAALGIAEARRRDRLSWSVASGAAAGVAAHVYLSAWIGAAALALWAAWPSRSGVPAKRRAVMALVFAAGLAVTAAPLFLFRGSRSFAYFSRTSYNNVLLEIRRTGSLLPPFAAAADALVSPWFLGDPIPRQDLPGRSRLGWILGIPVAVALARALARPKDEVSGFLLAQGAAAFAAAVAGGQAHLPHGFRFAYLTTVTAVAAASGVVAIVGALEPRARRAGAAAVIGLLAVSGALAARDGLLEWPLRKETFDSFAAMDFLIGKAAARWEDFGEVQVSEGLGFSRVTIETVRRFRIGVAPPSGRRRPYRAFRVTPPGIAGRPGERVVERVRDGWGREWAVVSGEKLGGRSAAAPVRE